MNTRTISPIIALFFLIGVPNAVLAQDPLEVAPGMYSLKYENDRVRVMEVVFQPGEQIAEHSHPDHFAYVLETGKLTISKPDGTVSDAELNVGDVVWIEAETHSAVNSGTTPVRLLVVELKESKPVVEEAAVQEIFGISPDVPEFFEGPEAPDAVSE